MATTRRIFLALGATLAIAAGGGVLMAQMTGMHGSGHGHGTDHVHDEVNMPGLRGLDATAAESEELRAMFRGFERISREVENLPDGIRTYTWSDDPEMRDILVSHVTGMLARVEEGRDPKVLVQSPTLDILFERRDRIVTETEATDTGIIVIQTSTDPEVAAALQTHAAEVTEMAERGMAALHDMMMRRN